MDSSVKGEGRRSLTSGVARAFFICFGFGRGEKGERVCSLFYMAALSLQLTCADG